MPARQWLLLTSSCLSGKSNKLGAVVPVGEADVWDEPALSCASLITGDRKMVLFCPHQGLKQREPKQLFTYQFGPEYHSRDCRLFSRSFSFILINNVVLQRS